MGLFSRKTNTTNTGGGKLSASLRDEKQKSTIIVNSIEDAVVLIDNDNAIQMFNPGAETLTGWSSDEVQGLDYRTIIRLTDDKGQNYPDTAHPFYMVFQNKKTMRDNEAVLIKKNNKTVSVDISISPLMDEKGIISGAVGVFRNVDAQRRQDKRSADFISTASHEMRTPVAAIEGYLALALNDKVATIDDKARSYLEKAHSSTNHLGQLFQDLLTSAKAEDGRLTSHPEVINMGEYVEQLVEDLRFSAETKGLKLELLTSTLQSSSANQKAVAPMLYVFADPDRVREVITNLFDNAVKYTDTGKISIAITGDNEVVQFYIQDTGNGIPKEDISHLFQKFYRVDNSATRTIGGTGLGLFICRKIVELYNGRIWAESELDKGSTFYINLPRLSTEQAEAKLKENPTVT